MDAEGTVGTRNAANDATPTPLTVGNTEFHFSLASPRNSLPHISQIRADSVANGTVISCSAPESNNRQVSVIPNTAICIIGNGCGKYIDSNYQQAVIN